MSENASRSELTGMLKVLRDANGPLPRPYYQSYLLRLWREEPNGAWRVSLENITNGEKHGFAHFEQLVAFLEADEARLRGKEEPPPVSQPNQPSDFTDTHPSA
jgi:hypothetical protein